MTSKKPARPTEQSSGAGAARAPYDPLSVEPRRYNEWLQRGYFHAEVDPARTPHTIMMPLPNITGTLHMGHALNHTVQDLLTRWRGCRASTRCGFGTDQPASRPTRYVTRARKQASRFHAGREVLEFAWQGRKYSVIYNHILRMGLGVLGPLTFTMDPADKRRSVVLPRLTKRATSTTGSG